MSGTSNKQSGSNPDRRGLIEEYEMKIYIPLLFALAVNFIQFGLELICKSRNLKTYTQIFIVRFLSGLLVFVCVYLMAFIIHSL